MEAIKKQRLQLREQQILDMKNQISDQLILLAILKLEISKMNDN